MLKKLIYFIGGWILCIIVLNKFVFQLLLEVIKNNEAAATSLTIITVVVFTIVWGVIVGISE